MRRRSSRARRALWLAGATLAIATASACNGWSPLDPFQHNAPQVDEAITSMDAGKYQNAERLLAGYLKTGICADGGIGVPEELLVKPNGSFDLGLTLFKLAEKFGRRFGDEESFAEAPEDKEGRAAEVACALAIVDAIAHDPKVPPDLRARAAYLAGNLKFLLRQYVQAIRSYDEALSIVPGLDADAGVDGIGRDAAHNRALALRRLVEQELDGGQENPDGDVIGPQSEQGDAGDGGKGEQDASDDGGGKGDSGGDAGDGDEDDDNPESAGPDAGDAGKDAGAEGTPEAAGDAGRDAGSPNDDSKKDQVPASPQPGEQQKGSQQDDRMLDRLEETPSYQQQEARMRANRRRHTMEDK